MAAPVTQTVDLGKLSREEIIEITKKQSQQIREKNQTIQNLNVTLTTLRSTSGGHNDIIAQKEEQLATIRSMLHAKVAELEALQTKTASWKQQVMDMALNDQNKIQSLQQQLLASQQGQAENTPTAQQALAARDATISELRGAVDALQARLADSDGASHAAVAGLQADVAARDATISELRALVEGLRSTVGLDEHAMVDENVRLKDKLTKFMAKAKTVIGGLETKLRVAEEEAVVTESLFVKILTLNGDLFQSMFVLQADGTMNLGRIKELDMENYQLRKMLTVMLSRGKS